MSEQAKSGVIPERELARRLAHHVLDRPRADPDDDLAVLARQLLRADEVITSVRDSWGKAEARRDTLAARNGEMLKALTEINAMPHYIAPVPAEWVEGLRKRYERALDLAEAAISKAEPPTREGGER